MTKLERILHASKENNFVLERNYYFTGTDGDIFVINSGEPERLRGILERKRPYFIDNMVYREMLSRLLEEMSMDIKNRGVYGDNFLYSFQINDRNRRWTQELLMRL